MSNDGKVIYIAHKLSTGDSAANMASYLRLCAYAMDLGHTVVSWAHHYMLHTQEILVRPGTYWLAHDARLLSLADELWICCAKDDGSLPDSVGIRAEIDMAVAFGIPRRLVWADGDSWELGAHLVGGGTPDAVDLLKQTLELILLRAGDQYEQKRESGDGNDL